MRTAMTKTILTTFLLFTCLTLAGQKKIENNLTPQHRNIPGTGVSLIPPEGFSDGQNFVGLQQRETASSIMVTELPVSYTEIAAGITRPNLLSKGVVLKKLKTLTINKLPATLITGKQNAYGSIFIKYILIVGTDSSTVMINGVYPEKLKKTGAGIKKSMLTTVYEEGKKADPLDALDYTIDVSGTRLRMGAVIQNSLIFSVDGQVPTASDDKTALIIAKSFAEMVIQDKKRFCENRLKQLPDPIEQIESTNEIVIDGISGYEIYAKGKTKNSGETQSIYQVILFSDNLYYVLIGITNDKSGESIAEIKKAVQTFRRK